MARAARTYVVEAVDEKDANSQPGHNRTAKEHLESRHFKLELLKQGQILLPLARAQHDATLPPLDTSRSRALILTEVLKALDRDGAGDLVEVCNVLQHLDGVGVPAAKQQKLGRLLELEEEEARDPRRDGDGPNRKHGVAPAPIVALAAAGLPGGDVAARLEVGGARVVWDEAVGDGGADDDAEGLKDGQRGEEPTLAARQQLEADGGVDGDVAADADADKGRQHQHAVVRVRRPQADAKDAGDQHREVEGPVPPDDVRDHAPEERPRREPCVEGRAEVARVHGAEAEFLLDRREDEAKGLGPPVVFGFFSLTGCVGTGYLLWQGERGLERTTGLESTRTHRAKRPSTGIVPYPGLLARD